MVSSEKKKKKQNEARETDNTFCPKLAECYSIKFFLELVSVNALHIIISSIQSPIQMFRL